MDKDSLEFNLDRSIRLLEEAVPKTRKLFRLPQAPKNDSMSEMDFSVTINPPDTQFFLDNTDILETNSLALSSTASFVRSPTERRTDQLYVEFLEILQTHTNDSEIFDTITELTQAVTDAIGDVSKQQKRPHQIDWLIHEKNTWLLLFALFKDRMVVQKDEMEVDDLPLVNSEKVIVEHLYAYNAQLREYQLIVDWLEETAFEESAHLKLFLDGSVGWENTLHQLQNLATVFGASKEIVVSLDPDAPFREKKPLHELDAEDEQRITRQIFTELRQGRFDEAQALCERYGQTWRAAILEGWRLHHDPNYESSDSSTLKQPIEGNPRRDLWKRCAWQMADNVNIDPYSRAIAGLFCGHLGALLNVAKSTWADTLWAYLKCQIDIRVESEIRECCLKSCLAMPETYWNNKLSLEQIFDELAAHKNPNVKIEANNPVNIIQKYLILDDMAELMRHVDNWLQDSNISSQMLRFLTHVVLFMRQIGKSHQEEVSDRLIKVYVESLIKLGNAQLVAFYTAALPSTIQLGLYSKFLETITKTEDRRNAFNEATIHGLDIQQITYDTVERIRTYENTGSDDLRIKSLEWLTFHPEQICDLLWQANAFVRSFMAQGKTECIRATFKMVPNDAVKTLINTFGTRDDLPHREDCSIKEYFCHQTYLAAIDGYNTWSDCFYNDKPKVPVLNTKPSGFTEKVAQEHLEQTYHADMEKWKTKFSDQTTRCRDLFYNILLFPAQGWLQEESHEDFQSDIWTTRATQMENLRKIVIPEIVLFLHKILTLSGNHKECIKLADELANEERQVFQVYSKQKLGEFLAKIAESSLALMDEKKDPWGYAN